MLKNQAATSDNSDESLKVPVDPATIIDTKQESAEEPRGRKRNRKEGKK